jgi:hypothetical protein
MVLGDVSTIFAAVSIRTASGLIGSVTMNAVLSRHAVAHKVMLQRSTSAVEISIESVEAVETAAYWSGVYRPITVETVEKRDVGRF